MLAGKEAKSFFERFFKNITSLVAGSSNAMQESLYFIAAALLVICSTTTKNRTRYRQGNEQVEVCLGVTQTIQALVLKVIFDQKMTFASVSIKLSLLNSNREIRINYRLYYHTLFFVLRLRGLVYVGMYVCTFKRENSWQPR